MSVFRRKNTVAPAIPEDLQPYYSGQKSGFRRWLAPIFRIVLLLAVLALLVWGGVAIVNKLMGKDENGKAKTGQTASQNDKTKKTQSGNSAATPSPSTPSPSSTSPSPSSGTPSPSPATTPTPPASTPSPTTPAPTPTPTPTPTPSTPSPTPSTPGTTGGTGGGVATTGGSEATQGKSLTNTGPGNVVALFAGVSIVAAILHRTILGRIRRSTNS